MNVPISLMLIDDQRLLCDCLQTALRQDDRFVVLDVTADAEQDLEPLRQHRPDVVLVDGNLLRDRAYDATRRISREFPDVKVIVLGVSESDGEVIPYIEAGASGYITKEASLEKLKEIILQVHGGEMYCSPEIASAMFSRVAELSHLGLQAKRLDNQVLTARELEVLRLIAEGLDNDGIANRLHVSAHTVKNHIHNIFKKIKVRRRIEAVNYGHRQGWLPWAARTSRSSLDLMV